MKIGDWAEKIAESSLARIGISFLLVVLIGSFIFLAWRASADLAAAQDAQSSLAQQTRDIHTAGSLNDFYDKGWLADDRNFNQLGTYIRRLVSFSASPSLDPAFKQELDDYIQKNQTQLPKESLQIEQLTFSEGILRQHQSRLLDMYDELDIVFRTMHDIVAYWDLDTPQGRGEKMFTIQDAFSTASVEFQATTNSHKKILKYAKLLDAQSKQASATEQDKMRAGHAQFNIAIAGLIVSVLLLAGWIIFLVNYLRTTKKDPEEGAGVEKPARL